MQAASQHPVVLNRQVNGAVLTAGAEEERLNKRRRLGTVAVAQGGGPSDGKIAFETPPVVHSHNPHSLAFRLPDTIPHLSAEMGPPDVFGSALEVEKVAKDLLSTER